MYIDKEFSAPRHLSVSSTSLSEATMIAVNTIAYFMVRLGEKLDEKAQLPFIRCIPLRFLNPSVKGRKLCMKELRSLGEPNFMFMNQRFTFSTATQPNTSLPRVPFSSKSFLLHYHGFDAYQQNPKITRGYDSASSVVIVCCVQYASSSSLVARFEMGKSQPN